MNFILKPSLEHIALTKIAARLWNQGDIRDLMENFCTPFNSAELKKEWPQIEGRVNEKVSKLPLPELLKEKVLGLIKPIGSQILRWMKYYGDTFLNIDLPNEFCWTPQGTVNEKKTAELLIKDESIDVTKRYKISCIYCLGNDILKLWNEVPENCKQTFYNEKDPMIISQPDLVVLWTYDIKGELSKIKKKLRLVCSPYQYACRFAVYDGNKAATEYLLQKLTPKQKKTFLISIAEYIAYERMYSLNKYTEFLYEYYSDILCTLLIHMDEEQQTEIFQKCPYHVLVCLLDWPYQSFFVKTASHLWTFLSENVYDCLLMKIINKVMEGFKDFNYQKLLSENWQQSPIAFKRSVLNGDINAYLLSKLFEIRDVNNIKLMLHDATITEKQKIISSQKGHTICKHLIDSEEWSLLKFFIQECLSSKDEMIKFKTDFQKSMAQLFLKDALESMKDKWQQFFSLLDGITYESNKRKFMEDDDSEAKRLVTKL